MSSGSAPSRCRLPAPSRGKGANVARLCPQDHSQRPRKSGDSEIIPAARKFRRAAAGLCHSRAPCKSHWHSPRARWRGATTDRGHPGVAITPGSPFKRRLAQVAAACDRLVSKGLRGSARLERHYQGLFQPAALGLFAYSLASGLLAIKLVRVKECT